MPRHLLDPRVQECSGPDDFCSSDNILKYSCMEDFRPHQSTPSITNDSGPTVGAFLDYLATLQPWESLLFHSLEMKAYPTKMASLLISNTFLSASDWSIKFSTHPWLSFRWSLSLPNGRRLATCSGPVYGAEPSSYHGEGYGMLSLLSFLICFFEYCNTQQDNDGIIVCDNLSIINKVI
jgi:hypothetical protein